MATEEKYIVIDIDGCISDDRWRMALVDHSIANPDERYAEYNSLCSDDFPLTGNIRALAAIVRSHENVGLIFLTARPESVRRKTWAWLENNARELREAGNRNEWLVMRPPGNHDHSPVLKPRLLERWLNRESKTAEDIIVCVDDRHDVLAAYKEAGFPVQWMGILGEPCPLEAIEAKEQADSQERGAVLSPQAQPNEVELELLEMVNTSRQRGSVYGNRFGDIGAVLRVIMPGGAGDLVYDPRWHILEMIISKLIRFANSGLEHEDSIHDLGVYAAIMKTLIPKKENKGD